MKIVLTKTGIAVDIRLTFVAQTKVKYTLEQN